MPGWRHGSAPDSPATRSPAWAPALMYPRQFTHLDGHNAYEVLGVGTWATRSDIELARRRLAGQVHPDLPTGDAARMSLVNAAAAILLDDAQRDAYDAYLASVSPARRSTPRPVDRTPSSARDQHRDPRDPPRDPHRDLNRGLFGDPSTVRDRSTRLGNGAGDRSAEPPSPSPTPYGRRGRRDGSDLDEDRDRRPRPTRGATRGPTRGSPSGAHVGPTRHDGDRATEAWGSEPREPGRAERRRPSPGPSRARTGRIGSVVPPWEDEPYDGPRPALRWQPPPPGPIARWRANRRRARQLARGDRPRRLKAGSPIPVLGLFVMIVAICAIGGAALGYSVAGGSSPSPARSPSTPATAPTHPRPSPTGHHK
jgi:curved DNA-binding protein CbpA